MRSSSHVLLALTIVLPLQDSASALTGAREVPNGSWSNVALLDNGCTGVLVHRTLIVYAAHCGPAPTMATFGPFADGEREHFGLRQCGHHPRGGPASPFDVSYCFLENRAPDVPTVPLATSTAAVGVEEGTEVVVVGFGRDEEKPPDGAKRELHSRIESVGDTLLIGGSAGSICEGDSGAPAFARLPSAEGTGHEWRIIGIASATYSPECDGSVGIFVFVPNVLGWLAEATGLALSAGSTRRTHGQPNSRHLDSN